MSAQRRHPRSRRLIERTFSMMARHAIVACLFLAATATYAGAQPAKPAAKPAASSTGGDPVVARVNGEVIHRSDVQIAYSALPAETKQRFTLEQAYPRVIDELVSMIVVEQAAHKARIDSDPVVKKRISLAQAQILQDAYFNTILTHDVTKDKLQAAYAQYAKDAPTHEEIEARHILVPTEQEANDIIAQLKKGADFATLAKEKTTDPAGKASGGDLGWFTQNDMVPEFTAAAFKLKKGEYTQTPVKTQFGWHVIKVEDRRPMKVEPYEQEAPRLAQQMAQGLIAQRVKQLDSEAKVEIFALDGSPLQASNPPAAPQAAKAPATPAAPKLAQPGAAAPGAPVLSPATAPDQLQH
jgi:peptidyl-prolyl cis-trans isomerase C